MSIKEMWDYLVNKKWTSKDIGILIFMLLSSIFATPVLGIPLGVLAFLIINEDVLDDNKSNKIFILD